MARSKLWSLKVSHLISNSTTLNSIYLTESICWHSLGISVTSTSYQIKECNRKNVTSSSYQHEELIQLAEVGMWIAFDIAYYKIFFSLLVLSLEANLKKKKKKKHLPARCWCSSELGSVRFLSCWRRSGYLRMRWMGLMR